MIIETVTTLKEYIQACTLLGEDLNQAILDFDFKADPDHKIYYAVDFSELYEYILPSEAYRDFIYFPQAFEDTAQDKASAIAIQQLILRYILLELDPGQIILLHPYLLEYSKFIQKYHSDVFRDFIKTANLLYTQFQKISSKKLDKKIIAICQKAHNDPLTTDEENELADFIAEYGPLKSLIENMDSQDSPGKRLDQLNVHHTFKKLDSSLLQYESYKDYEVYDRWVRKLEELRRSEGPTSKIDAMAIQMVYTINQTWPKNQRLVLITRSKYMHDIYKQEVIEKYWDTTGDYYLLRHPRVFGLVLPMKTADSPYNRDYLANLLERINRFLAECKSCQSENLEITQSLQNQIDEIQEQWQKIQQFAITLGSETNSTHIEKSELAKQAQIIMDGIRDQLKKGKLVQYLETLMLELDDIHEYLNLSIQGLPDQLRNIKTLTSHNGLLAISVNNLYMPFMLYLESELAIEKIRSVTSHKAFTSLDFKNFLRQNREYEGYESHLIKAYVWGVVGRWDVAETYCRIALTQEHTSENLLNEAEFWLAVCITQQQASFDCLLEAYHLLKQISDKPESSHYNRNQIEEGILILKLNSTNSRAAQDIPSAMAGLFLLRGRQAEIQEDASLWLHVVRTKLDYYRSQGDMNSIQNLKPEWEPLENALLEIEPHISNWPPVVLDSVAWVKWLLFCDEFTMKQEHQVILDMLHMALEMTPPDLEVHNEIEFHLKEIQKKIKPASEK
jgi:hypothetical protein